MHRFSSLRSDEGGDDAGENGCIIRAHRSIASLPAQPASGVPLAWGLRIFPGAELLDSWFASTGPAALRRGEAFRPLPSFRPVDLQEECVNPG